MTVGSVIELVVGPVAHGGHCVARVGDRPDGRVVFVRYAIPGERVRALVTDERSTFLRADAVEVLAPSPDRVAAPCPYAGPGACGGCDFQHVRPDAQRKLKAAVVREQLTRLAGLTPGEVQDLGVRVEPLPGGPLGWRTRVQYAIDGSGQAGFRRHRSHDVIAVDRCLIAHEEIQALPVTGESWPPGATVEAVRSSLGDVSVFVRGSRAGRAEFASGPTEVRSGGAEVVSGPTEVAEWATGRRWTVAAGGFWQVHPAAAETFASAVLEMLEPRPGERAWDLYGGVGLFAAVLADAVGTEGRVTLVDGDRRATAAAARDLADLSQVRVARSDVAAALADPRWRSVDLVVLDPPRSGAGAAVVEAVAARSPRAVAYVACDPAAFARDVRTFGVAGYGLARLRAFDAFPMTHHVEMIGLFTRFEPRTAAGASPLAEATEGERGHDRE